MNDRRSDTAADGINKAMRGMYKATIGISLFVLIAYAAGAVALDSLDAESGHRPPAKERTR